MKTERTSLIKAGLKAAAILSLMLVTLTVGTTAVAHEENPRIQLAILLDTSGSMEGLISQAQTQLWKIVNEFAVAERDGRQPDLEVALYEYGKSSLLAEEGYIRMILPLTTDLDAVSEELFALKTNGGDEYCGWVIQDAVSDLDWSASGWDFKAIFIAGNEPFTQGGVDFRSACQASIDRQIVVNTIHCGPYQDGVAGLWQEGALLADGKYMNIDQDRAIVHVDAPQDEEIARLSALLNATYIPFGSEGVESAKRQEAQDTNAQVLAPAVSAERALFKASGNYRNAAWDLVDAVKEGEVDLEELDEDALPEEMRSMTEEERKTFVEENQQKRDDIQEQIQRLSDERKTFVAEKRKEVAEGEEDTLDEVMIEAIREQASALGFELE